MARTCQCMTEDPGDGFGERVVTHSSGCPEHPEYDGPTSRVETVDGASRCRNFNAKGRQCGNYTKRVVVVERPGQPDYRTSDCGRH